MSEEVSLEALSAKYASELANNFPEISADMVLVTTEGFLRYLIDAEILNSFAQPQKILFHKI